MTAVLLGSCSNQNQDMNNPFFEEWTANHGAVPFDRIRTEHYRPAFERGIADEDREIDAIAHNPEAPTFQNTIEALEYTGALLSNEDIALKNNVMLF